MKRIIIGLFFLLSFSPSLQSSETKSIPTVTSTNKKFLITSTTQHRNLKILEATSLKVLRLIPLIDKQGNRSEVSGIHDARLRNSFIVTLKNSPELWEINYETPPPAGFGTWVHDYRKDSGEATITLFPIRRITVKKPLNDFFLDNSSINVISVSCNGEIVIVDLDIGKVVATFNLSSKKTVKAITPLNSTFLQELRSNAKQFIKTKCLKAPEL